MEAKEGVKMKSQKIAALWVLVVLVACGNALGEKVKVGYVDLKMALQTVDAGKKAKSMLDKELAAKRSSLEKRQKALQKEAMEFEKKAAIMNEGARAKKQAELQKKFVDFQKNMAQSQVELQKKELDLTKPILDELRAIVEGMGKKGGYNLILEKNEGAVLYAEKGSDLTTSVIKQFNKRKKK